MAEISTAKRKALPADEFALPEERAYPIHDAAHVRNAAARLEQQKGSMPPAKYAKAKAAIARAAKRFGITSEYNKPKPKSLHIRADLASGGSLHVRHMSDGSEQAETLVELANGSANGEAPVWIQIAKRGSFFKGSPFVLDDKVFDDIVANFNATQNRRVPIDFEHASESDPADGNIPVEGAPAQGWITQIEKRNDGLYGLVEWLPLARDYIRAGQYRYFSPAIRFNSRDRNTGRPIGAKLSSGALTNSPFLDGMKPLAAKDDSEPMTASDMLSAVEALHAAITSASSPDAATEACARCCDLCALCCEAYCANPTPENEALCRQCCELCARMCAECCAKMSGDSACMRACQACEACCRSCCADPATFAAVCAECCEACSACCNEMTGDTITPDEDDDESAAGMADRTNTEDTTTMADTESTISLKDHEAKVSALSLQLKDAETKLAAAEGEIAAFKDAELKRVEAEGQKRVETAFATYKDARKLTDADKTAMSIVLKNDPALFDKLYPAVAPSHAPLLQRLTAARTGSEPAKDMVAPTMKQLVDKHVKDGKTIEEATSLALTEARAFASISH